MARILVVDDDVNSAFITSEMFRDKYEVSVAYDPMEALEIMKQVPVDVLVTDLCMPKMDGFRLIEHARKIRPNLPVIVISAYYDDTDGMAYRMGKRYADVIFTKPFRRESINNAIDRLLEFPP